MSRKRWLMIGLGGIGLCICVIVIGVLVIFLRPSLLNPKLPVYTYTKTPSTHAGYDHFELTLGDKTYVSDSEEYALFSPGSGDHAIGQTADGMLLYEVYGQTNYVVLYSFMDPVAVFRNSKQPVLDLSTITVTHLKLASAGVAPGTAPEKDTDDPQLIQAVMSSLRKGTPVTVPSAVGDMKKYCLYLSGGNLYGMQYCAGTYVDQAGQVYLARDALTKDWLQADPLFSAWVKTP